MKLQLSHSESVNRLHEINERMEELHGKPDLSRSERREFDSLADEFDEVNRHRERLEVRHEMAQLASSGRVRTEGGATGMHTVYGPHDDLYRDDDHPRNGFRDRAMWTLDRHVKADRLPARSAEVVEQLTKTGSGLEQGWAARMVGAVGSDAYLSAFSKLVGDPQRGHLLWNAQEQEAFRVVEQLRSETRAMSTVDTQGGYAIPLSLDPSILITSSGSINPLRQISRVVQITTDVWNGITSAGVTAEWLGEASEAADASPTLAQPSIPVYKAAAFCPFSYEISQDALNFITELGKLLSDAYDQLTAAAFTTGSGTGQPTGLITALAGTASQVNTASADTLAPGDVYNLQNQLPPRFQANAQWAAALATLNTLRQFETSNGALKFPSLQDNPPTLLGRNANELSNMDSTIDAGQNNHILVYGSFDQFVVVDRWPSQLEIIPNLFGANRRPTGQRGAFLWARTGSNVVVPNAFRLLTA
jgi:HK97 family phage major capsid protein